jgi:SAM-dependent methyltransferase
METFDGDWLDLREPFDARARSQALAADLRTALPENPRILDLGAGTGALLRWLAPLIGGDQSWTLVDSDPALLARAFITIRATASASGWDAALSARDTMQITSPFGRWRITACVADLRDAPGNLPLGQTDIVVNTALCDLVSDAWVARMAASLANRRLPFYSALNVDGRDRFNPPHRFDAVIARGFARDQARDKGFGGTALGTRASASIARHFTAHGYEIRRAATPWRIGRHNRSMAMALADGHAQAAHAREHASQAGITKWRDDRHAASRRGRLSVRIGHTDTLALPTDQP